MGGRLRGVGWVRGRKGCGREVERNKKKEEEIEGEKKDEAKVQEIGLMASAPL